MMPKEVMISLQNIRFIWDKLSLKTIMSGPNIYFAMAGNDLSEVQISGFNCRWKGAWAK
jgi:hypothetical protein